MEGLGLAQWYHKTAESGIILWLYLYPLIYTHTQGRYLCSTENKLPNVPYAICGSLYALATSESFTISKMHRDAFCSYPLIVYQQEFQWSLSLYLKCYNLCAADNCQSTLIILSTWGGAMTQWQSFCFACGRFQVEFLASQAEKRIRW